jgi:hypothetical protein
MAQLVFAGHDGPSGRLLAVVALGSLRDSKLWLWWLCRSGEVHQPDAGYSSCQCAPPEIFNKYSATELRISSAVLVQAKGRGFSFHCSIQSRISVSIAWTDLWTPRRIAWSVR